MTELVDAWQHVVTAAERKTAPALLYKDKDALDRVLRDQFTGEVDVVIADSLSVFERVTALAERHAPHLAPRVRLYDDDHPIFDAFGVEAEMERMFRRKIWLRSGGYVVIDEAEALVAIDVNTGRYLGRVDQDDTILKTNLEAAAEIARQIRLRNIGGLIVVDFIDMTIDDHRRQVMSAFKEHLGRDRARSKVLSFSELGLVEMTRQRRRGGTASRRRERCPYCRGKGAVRDFATLGQRLERELDRRFQTGAPAEVTVLVHSRLKTYLEKEFRPRLTRLELDHGGHIRLVSRDDVALDAVEIIGPDGGRLFED
jgi:ribonuclease G